MMLSKTNEHPNFLKFIRSNLILALSNLILGKSGTAKGEGSQRLGKSRKEADGAFLDKKGTS